ncbi:hypothetical protein Rhe02_69200 [Rhizocola hellebori]|uniref:Uncharacterized protein n=1 Tax=Rhizocola hellebori TaxID=1392758 RepID=A0A8J3QDF8_9ACTN|nr:hypothetical protein [Rhizocola hellebori]GIH08853.1 hypothetical protein Rhe02_69200 [Rhizocola hellebori]
MRVEVELVDDADEGLAELLAFLQADSRLDDATVQRGQPAVRPGSLGAPEVLEFIATDALLPLAVQALYDFLRGRVRGGSDKARLVLTRTDLPDGTRRVEVEFTGTPEAAVEMVRDALTP